MSEVLDKIQQVRAALHRHDLGAARFKGVDWFHWITGGCSNVVLSTMETGIAEVLVCREKAWILTDTIEYPRLTQDIALPELQYWAYPWHDLARRDAFVVDAAKGDVSSDRPHGGERELPSEIVLQKQVLMASEIARYRDVGKLSAQGVRTALSLADAHWSEWDLAAEIASQLLRRGVEPALVLAAGEHRSQLYRHPMPTQEKLGGRAMVSVCARKHGLYANLTRFIYFRHPTAHERKCHDVVAEVEATALEQCTEGASLGGIFRAMTRTYIEEGYPAEESRHHQGGTTGYLSRERIAGPHVETVLQFPVAVAWNPTVPGAKLEDTFLCTQNGLENLTEDPDWPCTLFLAGRLRPDIWLRDSK